MAAIQVRGLDQRTVTALKARAFRHRRSLPNEVKHILTDAAQPEERLAPRRPPRLRLRTVRIGAAVSYSRATIYGDARS